MVTTDRSLTGASRLLHGPATIVPGVRVCLAVSADRFTFINEMTPMLRQHRVLRLITCSVVLAASACTESNAPTSPATTLTVVSPAGGATNVAVASPIVLTFSGPMGQGMEAYMDVHAGTTAAATMAMTCTWSVDRTALICTHAPMTSGTMYTIHVGGGMMDADDMPIGMGDMINQMGGMWLQPGMNGGMHAGQPMNMMGAGWMGTNGNYGMIFTFTTS